MSNRVLGYSLAITTGLCWAVLAIVLKYTLTFADSATIAWVRLTVAASLLLTYFLIKKTDQAKAILKKPPLSCIVAGLFLAFNYYGYMKCIDLTTANNTQIMIQIGPVLLLMAGVFYFKEELRPLQWLGVIIAAIGFCFFNWDQLLISFENQDKYIAGNLWVIGAAAAWAVFASLQKRLVLQNWTPAQTNLIIYMVCAVVLYPLASPESLYQMSAWQLFIMFCLGVNTIIAYGAFAEAMRLIPASKVSLIITCNPLITIFLMEFMAYYHLDFITAEPLMWRGYLGAALVVTGVAIAVSLRNKKKASKSPNSTSTSRL